jgi:hypothetical protein
MEKIKIFWIMSDEMILLRKWVGIELGWIEVL